MLSEPIPLRSKARLSVAAELLCACLRWPLGADERDRVARLVRKVEDWPHQRRLIHRHRVAGLASNALLTARADLPDDMRHWCEEQLELAGLRELAAAGDASAVVSQLAERGIHARMLKGPAVSLAAFGRLGLRTNRDLDLLVTPGERDEAARILAAAGWERVEPAADASAATLEEWLHNHKDFVFVRSGDRMLELHWGLFNNAALLPGLGHCAHHQVRSGPFVFDTLPTNENILYLCVHGAEHAWSRLKWLADVNALLRQLDEAELLAVVAEGRRRGVQPAVVQTIVLCERYLGLVVPRAVRRHLGEGPRVRAIVRIAERALFNSDRELEDQPWGSTLKNIGHYLMADGWRFRFQELRFDLTDLSAARLPDSYRRFGPFARFAAFVLRPAR